MPTVDPAAQARFDALIDEYEEVSRTVAGATAVRGPNEYRARTQLSYARRAFRLARLMAPAEGEPRADFDRQLDTVRTSIDAARRLITA
ncbi:hypothetical protein OG393_30915 [Streptomyces sp. NBC_01216]|uniref:hypothetical protein n=1 Tax=Streptomyces sp. NBC_01216 TaxID=2903778 RepID=UPI002E104A09|nr:hypothetical protein OG393_30915 [Streptomyces sp. NBC_01216]